MVDLSVGHREGQPRDAQVRARDQGVEVVGGGHHCAVGRQHGAVGQRHVAGVVAGQREHGEGGPAGQGEGHVGAGEHSELVQDPPSAGIRGAGDDRGQEGVAPGVLHSEDAPSRAAEVRLVLVDGASAP